MPQVTMDQAIDQIFKAREEAYLCYNLAHNEKLSKEIDGLGERVMSLLIADEPGNKDMSLYSGLRFLKLKIGRLDVESNDCITILNKLMYMERMKEKELKKVTPKRKREVPHGPPYRRPPGAPKKHNIWCAHTGQWAEELSFSEEH